MDTLTKLEKLLISEVSGVDDPANEAPGHLVLKSAAQASAVAADAGETSMVGKITSFLHGKEEVDMTKEELLAGLAERDDALVTKFAEAVAKAVAPVEVIAPAPVATAPAPAAPAPASAEAGLLTAEEVVKAIEEANAPLLEVMSKTLDRVEKLEKTSATAARKSLDGQEGAPSDSGTVTTTPTVSDAIAKALRKPQLVEAAA
jgi:hypothetical protein